MKMKMKNKSIALRDLLFETWQKMKEFAYTILDENENENENEK